MGRIAWPATEVVARAKTGAGRENWMPITDFITRRGIEPYTGRALGRDTTLERR